MAKKETRFTVKKEKNDSLLTTYVLVDKKTGVNYLFAAGGYSGGLTVMVDGTGRPIVTPVVEEE